MLRGFESLHRGLTAIVHTGNIGAISCEIYLRFCPRTHIAVGIYHFLLYKGEVPAIGSE